MIFYASQNCTLHACHHWFLHNSVILYVNISRVTKGIGPSASCHNSDSPVLFFVWFWPFEEEEESGQHPHVLQLQVTTQSCVVLRVIVTIQRRGRKWPTSPCSPASSHYSVLCCSSCDCDHSKKRKKVANILMFSSFKSPLSPVLFFVFLMEVPGTGIACW